MLNFGEKPKCLDCKVELTTVNISLLSRLHCKWCRPQVKRDTIKKYSGASQNIKGGYEK